MRNQILVTAIVCAMLAGCAAEPEPPAPEAAPEAATPTPAPLPEVIVAEAPGPAVIVPESLHCFRGEVQAIKTTAKRAYPQVAVWPGNDGRNRIGAEADRILRVVPQAPEAFDMRIIPE